MRAFHLRIKPLSPFAGETVTPPSPLTCRSQARGVVGCNGEDVVAGNCDGHDAVAVAFA
jgi:hypothetical protein